MFTFLKYEKQDGIGTITLNRPEVYNALNDEITYELQDALKLASKDDEVRVLILTGEGKAFCSGQDLKSSAGKTRSFKDSLYKRYNPIIKLMRDMPKPIIGKINGVAAGAGCSLALACDVIVAKEDTPFIEVFVNIGLVPDSGSSYFLPRSIGSVRAFELASMGSRLSGKKAAEWGLINAAVTEKEFENTVNHYAGYYAQAPTKAIGLIKKMLNKSGHSTLNEMLEYEALSQEIAGNTTDYKEGVSAFLEKRKAEFKGK
ncbi:MAG: enoyl-CoA hydratase-related protein [Cyclobacteriaceae bacterium]|nr:enoyl-CoA hydratase-related protein [Cyclobacteriaceae bacterium]